jgi:S1-C subfamily serine protease
VKAGDVLLVWAGKEVEDVTHWTGLLAAHQPGDEVRITVRRGAEELELTVKLKGR